MTSRADRVRMDGERAAGAAVSQHQPPRGTAEMGHPRPARTGVCRGSAALATCVPGRPARAGVCPIPLPESSPSR